MKFELLSNFFESSDGVNIHYLMTPERKGKPWFFFLHGAGGDASAWKRVQEDCFNEGYPSVAIDLRGHGLSDDPIDSGAYAFEKMAHDIDHLVGIRTLREVIVVGHCFGGMTSIVLAAKNPQYLSRLILVDTSDTPAVFGLPFVASSLVAKVTRKLAYLFPPGIKQVRPSYEMFIGTKDINLKRFISDVKFTSIRSYLFCCSDLFEFSGTSLLSKISSPTLVMCGEKDTIFPPRISRRFARKIPNAQLIIVPQANHIVVISQPDVLSKIILQFVTS